LDKIFLGRELRGIPFEGSVLAGELDKLVGTLGEVLDEDPANTDRT
jgi:hypothetical protein